MTDPGKHITLFLHSQISLWFRSHDQSDGTKPHWGSCAVFWLQTASVVEAHLTGLVIRASALGVEVPGLESRLKWDFSGSSHTSDLKIGTPVATLPGAWRYRVSSGTGQPGVSIL